MRYILILLLISFRSFAQQQPVAELHTRLKAAQTDSDRIKAYLEISRHYTAEEPDSAVEYCHKALELAEKTADHKREGLLLLQLGNINTVHHHEILARRFLNEALSVFRHQSDREGMARAYDALGLLDAENKNTNLAAADMNNALRYFGDTHDSSGMLEAYHGLGSIYEQKGDIERALSFYLRVLVQYEKQPKQPDAYFVLLERIGHLYLKKGKPAIALRYLEEGVGNSSQAAAKDTELTLLNEEGQVFEQQGQHVKALAVYKRELDEARKSHQPEAQANALINIARLLRKQNTAQSLNDLKQALQIASNLHEPKLEASIYEAMAGVYQQQKDYKEAMDALEEQHRLLDSLLSADTVKEIASIDSSYALENSREKIDTLQKVNRQEKTEISLAVVILIAVLAIAVILWLYLRKIYKLNKELRESNRIKDTLFSIIGHDLKGPAGSAAQMFAIMEHEDFSPEEMKIMISELRKQTAASFELLSALFEWGKAQLNGVKVQPEKVDVAQSAEKNVSLLSQQSALKNINVTTDIPENATVIADPNHVDFVIRNLVSNAIKFTNDGGSIHLSAKPEGDELIIAVADTGVGISADQQREFLKGSLKVSFGTHGEKGSGLGLLLTREFIAANHGRFWLSSAEGKGTTFYFSLPRG